MVFRDRTAAGKELAKHLADYKNDDCVVIALPRGGVPVAAEIANALEAPLDILAVRKIGAPTNPELALGSVTENGDVIYNEHILQALAIDETELQEALKPQLAEIQRQIRVFRDDRAPVDVRGRTVVLVDDGLATGATALSAVRHLRARGADKILVAIPACASESARRLREEVDQLICGMESSEFYAVSQWYEHFDQVSDEQVTELLNELSVYQDQGIDYREFRNDEDEPPTHPANQP